MNVELNSIILFVQNEDSLKSFYVDTLGLAVLEEIKSEWVVLKTGPCNIALHKIGKDYEVPSESFKANSNTKLVFETTDDIFKLREELFNKKVVISEIKTFDNYDFWLCDGEDPERNVFQLKQRKTGRS